MDFKSTHLWRTHSSNLVNFEQFVQNERSACLITTTMWITKSVAYYLLGEGVLSYLRKIMGPCFCNPRTMQPHTPPHLINTHFCNPPPLMCMHICSGTSVYPHKYTIVSIYLFIPYQFLYIKYSNLIIIKSIINNLKQFNGKVASTIRYNMHFNNTMKCFRPVAPG